MFVAMFIAVVAYVFWPGNKKQLRRGRAAALLDDDRQAGRGTADDATSEIDERHRRRDDGARVGRRSRSSTSRCRGGGCTTFYASIVWAIGYWIVYPAWPTLTGYTKGMLGYSQRGAVDRRGRPTPRLRKASTSRPDRRNAARRDREGPGADALRHRAAAPPRSATTARPATARGAQGVVGYPNLNDDDWLWGGSSTRSTRRSPTASAPATRRRTPRPCRASASTSMLEAGRDRRCGRSTCCRSRARRRMRPRPSAGPRSSPSKCAACHGADGKGKHELGAPNLTDGIWLYGGKQADIEKTIRDRARRRDAGLGRPPRPCDDQDARRLRPLAGRRQVAHAQASRRESSMTMINRAADIAPDTRPPRPRPASRASTSRPSTPAERTALSYASREKIYPKLAHGTFRNVKWAVMAVTLGIYYLLPWMRWDRGPSLPDQAFLLDFANQRLFFGPIEIWAQEFYYITGLLILSALGLFLVTSVAGRMWCGYTCPQTVWTDLMIVVERFWQGDRNARIRLDNGPWTFEKIWKKTATHLTWLLVGRRHRRRLRLLFPRCADARRRAPRRATRRPSPTSSSASSRSPPTCSAASPASRSASTCARGRASRAPCSTATRCSSPTAATAASRAGPTRRAQTWEGRGDCIDCKACVAVCPTGIDIRDGSQLECIQCALCIDACDDIMQHDRPAARADRLRHVPQPRRRLPSRARAAAHRAPAHACSMPR